MPWSATDPEQPWGCPGCPNRWVFPSPSKLLGRRGQVRPCSAALGAETLGRVPRGGFTSVSRRAGFAHLRARSRAAEKRSGKHLSQTGWRWQLPFEKEKDVAELVASHYFPQFERFLAIGPSVCSLLGLGDGVAAARGGCVSESCGLWLPKAPSCCFPSRDGGTGRHGPGTGTAPAQPRRAGAGPWCLPFFGNAVRR